MLSLVTLVAFSLLPAGPERFTAGTPSSAGCAVPRVTPATAVRSAFHRLGDLPDARLEIAVNRSVDGCPAPIIVRDNVSR